MIGLMQFIRCVFPLALSGVKTMFPPLMGWPSSVTVPETGTRLTPPQPTRKVNPRAPGRPTESHPRRTIVVAINDSSIGLEVTRPAAPARVAPVGAAGAAGSLGYRVLPVTPQRQCNIGVARG